jgi:hypothetical protein
VKKGSCNDSSSFMRFGSQVMGGITGSSLESANTKRKIQLLFSYFSSSMPSFRVIAGLISVVLLAVIFSMAGSIKNFWKDSKLGAS